MMKLSVEPLLRLSPNELFTALTEMALWYRDNKDKNPPAAFEFNPKQHACVNSMTIVSYKGEAMFRMEQKDSKGGPLIPSRKWF
jgi:hypothetical protein